MKLLESIFEELYYIYVDIRDHIVSVYQKYLNRRNFVKSFADLSIWCQDMKKIARGSDNALRGLFVRNSVMKIETRLREFNETGHRLSYQHVYDIVSSVNYIKTLFPKL